MDFKKLAEAGIIWEFVDLDEFGDPLFEAYLLDGSGQTGDKYYLTVRDPLDTSDVFTVHVLRPRVISEDECEILGSLSERPAGWSLKGWEKMRDSS